MLDLLYCILQHLESPSIKGGMSIIFFFKTESHNFSFKNTVLIKIVFLKIYKIYVVPHISDASVLFLFPVFALSKLNCTSLQIRGEGREDLVALFSSHHDEFIFNLKLQ